MDAIWYAKAAEIRADDKRGGFIREPGQEQGSGNIADDLRSQNCHQHFRPARMACSQPEKAGMRPRLPMKTKNATKVSSRE